ncbi:MAG: OPT/YSL family transporter [Acidobacteriales bacterium]|nr:OPT/YSL family transporter [Terriglobales bacterium]
MTDPAESVESTRPVDPIEATEEHWLKHVYQGNKMPQLTLRAVLMGGILGSLMSISNLYTTLKVGWSFGVAITACVLSYVIWKVVRLVFPKVSDMSILENNCMQSTASAAGYSTGATIGTAFGALLLITGSHISWQVVLVWTLVTAIIGVFLAVPMKRQMINIEKLPFPSGIAAAETLRSLHGQCLEAVQQAYALVGALVGGAVVGLFGKGNFWWQQKLGLKLPELLPFNVKLSGVAGGSLPGFGFEPSVLLIGAGMIVGMRVSLSMLIGSALLYLFIGPIMINAGQIEAPAKLIRWALWTGTAMMVTSGLTAFAVQWKVISRSFKALSGSKSGNQVSEEIGKIEVPFSWFIAGMIPLTIAMIVIEYVAFSISIPLGLLSIVMSFLLALVACRTTGETDTTPIGAMGKITQLTYAVLAPSNITTNLMAASVTANTVSSAADLLTDLKSGYLLGANARQQFIAQFLGVFFGTVAIVPAWYLMVPTRQILEGFNPPAANMWRAVAEALSQGIQYVPISARWGILIGGVLGIVLALTDHFLPKSKRFTPSAMGLGLSWVVPFANCLSFFIGAVIAWVWTKRSAANASLFVIPVASGAIAGESLACAIIAMINALTSFGK